LDQFFANLEDFQLGRKCLVGLFAHELEGPDVAEAPSEIAPDALSGRICQSKGLENCMGPLVVAERLIAATGNSLDLAEFDQGDSLVVASPAVEGLSKSELVADLVRFFKGCAGHFHRSDLSRESAEPGI